MMTKRIDIAGQKFGRLTVEALGPMTTWPCGRNIRTWQCRCDCGAQTFATYSNLKSGNTTSCGCAKPGLIRAAKGTHLQTDTPTYRVWAGMLTRCTNPNSKAWHRYGGRGISVCAHWRSFENFLADMGERPSLSHVLDRINNDGDYEPGNCRWVTQQQNCRNKSNNHILTYNGKSQTITAWAEELGWSVRTIFGRIRLGWPTDKVLGTPINKNMGQYDRDQVKKRRKLSTTQKIAAVLLVLKRGDGTPLIPPEMRNKPAKEIVKYVQWDHIKPIGLGGEDHFTNLQPLSKADHLEKTKRDIKVIAKTKRISKAEEEFRRRLLAKTTGEKPPRPTNKRKIPQAWNPWPKGRRLRSRSSFERRAT